MYDFKTITADLFNTINISVVTLINRQNSSEGRLESSDIPF